MSINPLLAAYRALKREIGLIASMELKKLGTSQKQMAMIFHLAEAGTAGVSELATHTQSDPAAVTRALQSLEAAGLVKKNLDPTDSRRSRVELTAKGRRKAETLEAVRTQIGERISRTLPGKELKELERLMKAVAEGLLRQREPR
jgi:DNA-binding MarR family transcriptional regulator